jgi:hypothetical protein
MPFASVDPTPYTDVNAVLQLLLEGAQAVLGGGRQLEWR